MTAFFIASAWSIPATPIFTSRICAPACSCSIASRFTEMNEPFFISAANFLRPVGFMRSPIKRVGKSLPMNTVLERLAKAKSLLGSLRTGSSTPFKASLIALICAGVVPQQPPIKVAPAFTNSGAHLPKSSGVIGKTVLPSTR